MATTRVFVHEETHNLKCFSDSKIALGKRSNGDKIRKEAAVFSL